MSDERFEEFLEQSMARGCLRICIGEMQQLLELEPGLIDGDHQSNSLTRDRLTHFRKCFDEANEAWEKVKQHLNLEPLQSEVTPTGTEGNPKPQEPKI